MESKENLIFEKYTKTTHKIGKIASILVLIMLVGAPFLIGKYLGAYPDLKAAGKGFFSVGLIWMISSLAEFLIYTPMLGSGGGYLAFITGNLINMKIPCAVNARDMVGAKSGTKENEIISTLSIATSLLQEPVLQPAFDNVVPALFGAMAYKYYKSNLKTALLPLTFMSLLFMIVPSLTGSTSFMIIPSGAMAIGIAYFFYKRDGRKNTK